MDHFLYPVMDICKYFVTFADDFPYGKQIGSKKRSSKGTYAE
jgi:hypothetical protein